MHRDAEFLHEFRQFGSRCSRIEQHQEPAPAVPVVAQHPEIAFGEVVFRAGDHLQSDVVGDGLDVRQRKVLGLDVLALDERLQSAVRLGVDSRFAVAGEETDSVDALFGDFQESPREHFLAPECLQSRRFHRAQRGFVLGHVTGVDRLAVAVAVEHDDVFARAELVLGGDLAAAGQV